MPHEKIAFVASSSRKARDALLILQDRYDGVQPADADVIVALGGDGFMLHTIHEYLDRDIPIYGMNRGSLGFLMNEYAVDDLIERLGKASVVFVYAIERADDGVLLAQGSTDLACVRLDAHRRPTALPAELIERLGGRQR